MLTVARHQEGHTLFTIPRDLVLSMRTSSLPQKFGQAEWKKFGLHTGWTGLMLCMLWEEAQGAASKWHGFFRVLRHFLTRMKLLTKASAILPKTFDTPMFWTEKEIEELKGTAVVGVSVRS